MRDWIVIAVLYLVGIGSFWLLGGISAAGEAFRRWGRSSSAVRRADRSVSS